ncbi:TIGR01777 family protein [Aliidiomarina taiwanensis]|uniref:TIGR01777 family protein n=1 Tax=Aliidiomarina taiwanensis TaxID=946228 RepID=A0A432X225_9GAMM|nr:TIGR01777 family oxidoreductase [Aliidiomarina taiwanensis]RUO40544.1 TIGR01777 family protein [Aliidiomarina taiwanensis]
MNILFTGGTGLIGSAFIKGIGQDYHYTVLTRQPEQAKCILGPKVKTITRLDALKDLNAFDAVINLAGEPIADKRWSAARKVKLEQSRWALTEQLIQLIQDSNAPPQVFISGSAVGYYGRQGQQPITEESATPHPEYSHTLCKVWEDTAQAAADKTRLCIVRTGIVLAPKGGALAKMATPFKLGLGGPIGSGQQMMSWIHLDDMVRALHFLLQEEACQGAFNATAPHPVSNREFSQTLARTLNRPCFFKVPAFVMRGLLGEMADLVLTGQAAIPKRLQDHGFEFEYPNLVPALRHTLQG